MIVFVYGVGVKSNCFSKVFKTGMCACVLGACSFGWSLYETKHPKVREYDLNILPEDADPVRVLHISDLHYRGEKSKWLANWFKKLDISNIDFVISTGDHMGADNVKNDVVNMLEKCLSKPGVFVFGSNDYYGPKKKNPFKYFWSKSPVNSNATDDNYFMNKVAVKNKAPNVILDSQGLADSLVSKGWVNLNNSCACIDLPQGRIELIGLDDPHISRDCFPDVTKLSEIDSCENVNSEELFVDPCEKLNNENMGDNSLIDNDNLAHDNVSRETPRKILARIGVAHAPYLSVISKFAKAGCALSCFGHTHGGQLCAPFFGALVSNCDLPPVFASGMFSLREIFSYVNFLGLSSVDFAKKLENKNGFVSISAGLGVAPMLPLRFACRPEVSVINLCPKK